ncbi:MULTISPECIES: flavocytochrome c [Terrabacteria group]|uniref:flavocytochrome c n=1 Tax=Bacillati TaxID=1783272 RepID=UPI001C6F4CEA|nr:MULTISPECIES: flavocytochrome c [Terrabacteria group]MBW9212134.1 flavocytochrome c [Trueperella sp. zg.1013]
MKKFLSVILLAFTLVLSACSPKSSLSFKAGTYTGSAKGRNGDVAVEVTLSEKKIETVKITKQEETKEIASTALKKIPEEIVKNQSLAVDSVSGATLTSKAILSATEAAIKSSGADVNALKKAIKKEKKKEETLNTDVVVVGAGGAGLTAAITAKQAGKNVVVLEKKAIAGGNSTLSTGGMNAAKTKLQDKNKFVEGSGIEKTLKNAEKYSELKPLADKVKTQYTEYKKNPSGYFDSVDLFVLDTMIGGKNLNNRTLVETLTKNSASAIDWLKENGADLSQVGSFGGASVKRIHKPVNAEGKTIAVGSYLVPILQKKAEELGVKIIYEAAVKEILVKDGKAVGVKADGYTVNAKSVVLTTGGFAGNAEMVVKLKPELKSMATTNTSGITGDGIKMAEAIGANTVDMNQIQIHPTVEYESKSLITEGLRGDGAILVNSEGKRFFDEVGTRDAVSQAELKQPGGFAWLVVDQAMVDKSSVIAGYIKKGYTKTGKSAEELAKVIGADEVNLANTLKTWNGYVANKKDPEFNRTSFTNPLNKAPYYAIKVSPGVHHTMGGIQINEKAEVLNKEGKTIANLFAAGEVTGGVHGANRLGGNAVADFVIFGRIAGTNAANNVK